MKVCVHNEIHSITSRGWWNREKTTSPLFLPSFACGGGGGGGGGGCSDETFILCTSRRTVPFFRWRLLQPNTRQVELERKKANNERQFFEAYAE